jgi:hypothetical protein
MSDTVIQIVGREKEPVNPGCCCGGELTEPAETVGEAVESLQEFLRSEGFRNVQVRLADPEDPACDGKMKELAVGHEELLPLTVINGKITFYSGLKKDMVIKILRKLGVE